jgi:hypothetical protein
MKGLIAILIVLTAAFALSQTTLPSQQEQFEKALAMEEVQGKLQDAIALYQKILDESKDQALAAPRPNCASGCASRNWDTKKRKAHSRR